MHSTRRHGVVRSICAGILLSGWMALAMAAEPQSPVVTAATTPGDVQRGRLLYETHCVACHTTQAHWRDKHLVKTQADLLYQVAKWQKTAGQSWGAEEIEDTAAYLNEAFYQLK